MASFRPALTEAHPRQTTAQAGHPVNSGPRPCLVDVGFPLSGPQDRTSTSDLKRHAWHTTSPYGLGSPVPQRASLHAISLGNSCDPIWGGNRDRAHRERYGRRADALPGKRNGYRSRHLKTADGELAAGRYGHSNWPARWTRTSAAAGAAGRGPFLEAPVRRGAVADPRRIQRVREPTARERTIASPGHRDSRPHDPAGRAGPGQALRRPPAVRPERGRHLSGAPSASSSSRSRVSP